jgi:hypothetical protein
MLKSKSQLTCSYCSKIFKNPIVLPCGDSICGEHLDERGVVKANKIKCKKCNDEFGVKDNDFKSNNELKKLIESHFSEEERSLKQELEDSIRKFFEFYDQFDQNKTQLESDIFEHFQEMRFKIDEQREELKKKIDDISLAMIDETQIYEAIYLNGLKEKFSSSNDCKSLEAELSKIEETFRNPNLLIQTIREMQRNQEESLKSIQFKLNQMAKIKDNVMETHFFMPNLSSFDQNSTSLFGSIRLNQFTNINSFKGRILKGEQQCFELIKLCEFSPSDKWSLLYRGTRDGFGADVFHSKCDSHSNTLTLVKAKESSYIFGGYTTIYWDSLSGWKPDQNAFIFSLTNKDNKPLKMNIDPNEHKFAIICGSEYGPTFGFDISVANNANKTMNSCSKLGYSYKHPQYAFETIEAETFLAGSHEFQLEEIEVYKKE